VSGATCEQFNAFFVKQSFFYSDLFRFWILGYPRVRGSVWRGHLYKKNLPLVGVETGTAVRE